MTNKEPELWLQRAGRQAPVARHFPKRRHRGQSELAAACTGCPGDLPVVCWRSGPWPRMKPSSLCGNASQLSTMFMPPPLVPFCPHPPPRLPLYPPCPPHTCHRVRWLTRHRRVALLDGFLDLVARSGSRITAKTRCGITHITGTAVELSHISTSTESSEPNVREKY